MQGRGTDWGYTSGETRETARCDIAAPTNVVDERGAIGNGGSRAGLPGETRQTQGYYARVSCGAAHEVECPAGACRGTDDANTGEERQTAQIDAWQASREREPRRRRASPAAVLASPGPSCPSLMGTAARR